MIRKVLLGFVGAVLGSWSGLALSACSPDDGCDCGDGPNPGVFQVNTVWLWQEESVPFNLEGATITVTDDAVSIEYSHDAADVTVTYQVTEKVVQ